MAKTIVWTLLIATLCLPARAQADAFVVGIGTSWVSMPNASSGNGNGGHWDNASYDSLTNQDGLGSGLCSAGSLVLGETCDWVESPTLTNPLPAGNASQLQYLAPTGAPVANQGDFFFQGDMALDLAMLFQLTNWDGARLDTDTRDSSVEFGWYRAGNPDDRHPLFGPGGPFTANDGSVLPVGQVSATLTGAYGFYYRNSLFGEGDGSEVLFFTEARFNRIGNYSSYFSFHEFANQERFGQMFEDEWVRLQQLVTASDQQFALFREGNRYWLGLEDQVGAHTRRFCANLAEQPCSDYDFNDLIVGFDATPVPEPAMLTLLALSLFGIARLRRRD